LKPSDEPELPFSARADAIGRAEAEDAVGELLRRALGEGDPTAWMARLLTFIRDMKRYSVFNAKLMFLQRPGAVAVGTARYWADRGRTIRPGALPIIILVPNGPICPVYEAEDTEGSKQLDLLTGYDDRKARTISDDDFRGFVGRVDLYGKAGKRKTGLFRVIEEGLGSARHGDVHLRRDESDRFVIRINRNAEPVRKFTTLLHELAHVFCGHMGPHPQASWPDRRRLRLATDKAQGDIKEFEAEAVAWIIASRAGIISDSPDYLASRVAPMDGQMLDINAVLNAANVIEPLSGTRT